MSGYRSLSAVLVMLRHCFSVRCGASRGSNPPGTLVCVYFRCFSLFFCYVYVNFRFGPLFCFIFKAETFVFQYKMGPLLPAVPCVGPFFITSTLIFVFGLILIHFFGCFRNFCATSTLIFVLGLFCVSFSRPKRLFSNMKWAFISLRSRASVVFSLRLR